MYFNLLSKPAKAALLRALGEAEVNLVERARTSARAAESRVSEMGARYFEEQETACLDAASAVKAAALALISTDGE